MVIDIVPGIVALAILILGAELIVHRSVHLARSIGISDIFIGLTLLSIGTSVPEISTAVIASIDILLGKVDHRAAAAAVLGTSIGSDILQQTLLIAAVIPFGLVVINHRALLRDFAMMLLEKADVAVSPGSGFGEAGDGYVRLALVENENRLRQGVRQIGCCLEREAKSGGSTGT